MLHTKSIATQDTAGWLRRCQGLDKSGTCRIGVPFPLSRNGDDDAVGLSGNTTNDKNKTIMDDKGWLYNCYVNQKIENYWIPLLEKELKDSQVVQIS